MISLTNSRTGKPVYLAIAHIVAINAGTTGAEILTLPGVIYYVHDSVEDILSALRDYGELPPAEMLPSEGR